MFLMSAIQMLSFVLIGNLILDIRGLTFDYWLLLFSTAALANLIGLNISAALNSVVNIYILIPFILVPQLLLSGVIVGYDKLHKSVNSYQYTPIVGDMMVSRWAYEALAVNQFRDNAYNHKLFWTDQHRSFCEYQYVFLIPELETRLNQALQERNKQKLQKILDVVHNEIQKIPNQTEGVPIYSAINRLNVKRFTPTVAESCFDYLRKLKKMYRREYETQNQLKDSIFSQLETDYGNKENIIALKDKYNNEKLTQILTNEMNVNKLKEIDGNIIQLRDPIYNIPTHRFGRAHYYAPVKRLGNSLIHTYWFNFGVLWFISAILYTILHADTLKKMIEYKLKPIQRKKQKL
jgi:hypothetical protein